MREQELHDRLKRLTGEMPAETHRIFLSAACPGKEAPIMKRKISAGLVFALVLILAAAAAIATGIVYDLNWWYTERTAAVDKNEVQAIMDHLVAEPVQQQSGDSLVAVSVREVSWIPEAGKLVVLLQAAPSDPEHYELHSSYALDPDDSPDEETHAEHWLWRENPDPDAGEHTGHGPVREMMDDSSKRLLLIDGKGDASLGQSDLPGYASVGDVRTSTGEVIYKLEYNEDWMSPEYDQKMKDFGEEYPNMKEYAEQQIAKAQAARAALSKEGISCLLSYRVVEYTEGMDDNELYTGGTAGQVAFSIRAGN